MTARTHKIPRLKWKAEREFAETADRLFWLRDWFEQEEERVRFFSKFSGKDTIKQRLADCINLLQKLEAQDKNAPLPEPYSFQFPEVLKEHETELKVARNPALELVKPLEAQAKAKKEKRQRLSYEEKEIRARFEALEETLDSVLEARNNAISLYYSRDKDVLDEWGKKEQLLMEARKLVGAVASLVAEE